MKILALILARKNSERLPKKNLRILGHKPLISWTIDLLKKIKHMDNILVSTDSKKIQKVALKSNVLCPKMRPKHLSGDKTTSEQSALYELRWYEKSYCKVDGLLLMQPTSPFIRPRDVSNCVKVMRGRDKWNSVQTVSLCPHQYHALNQRSLFNQQVAFICPEERELSYNKQTKDKHYVFGNVVGCKTKFLLDGGEIFSEPSYGIVIPLVFAFDLDVEEDIVVAETIAKGLTT